MAPPTLAPHLLPESITPTYTTSHTRLLLFDYDGTLTPIIPHPPAATLLTETRSHLNLLANNLKNEVWVISGRDRAFLTEQVGNVSSRLGLCAEHGAFARFPNRSDWVDLRKSENSGWRPYVTEYFDRLVVEIPGSELETKQAALAWHFRRAVADPEKVAKRAAAVAQELREALRRQMWRVEVVEGKCVVEVRADSLNKGYMVGAIIETPGKEYDFVACWGDDTTDEDMFKTLAESQLLKERIFAVKVGDGSMETSANWILDDPAEVRECMRWLTDADKVAVHGSL